MKIFIEIDTEKNTMENTLDFIRYIYNKKNSNLNQSKLEPDNNNDNNNIISIVVRNGPEQKTLDVKEDLKKYGFNYYKYKKNTQIEDPRYTLTCTRDQWMDIKTDPLFDGLSVWTSDGGD